MQWTFKIVVNATAAGVNEDIHYTFAARGTDALAYPQVEYAPRQLYERIKGNLGATIANGVLLTGFDWKWIDGTWAGQTGTYASSWTCNMNNGSLLPFQDCINIRRRTATGSYHGTGRLFLSPIRSGFLDPNNVNKVVDYQGRLASFCTVLTTAFNSQLYPWQSFEHVLLHDDNTADQITAADFRPYLAVRRTRRRDDD